MSLSNVPNFNIKNVEEIDFLFEKYSSSNEEKNEIEKDNFSLISEKMKILILLIKKNT